MKRRKPPTAGRLNSLWAMLLGSAVLAAVLIVWLFWRPHTGDDAKKLVVYCAAGATVPMELIAEKYEAEFKVVIDSQYGGSGDLLVRLETNKFDEADLYLAADSFYGRRAVELGLAREILPVAHQRPVIVVRKGNEKDIRTLTDLLREDVTVVVGNPDGPAIGRETKNRLAKVPADETNFWAKLEKHITGTGVFKPTVNDIALAVKLGHVDAGIVWDATVAMPKFRDELKAVPVPELEGDPCLLNVCVLNSSPNPTAALKFARYLTARDRGLPAFEDYGFRPVEGDLWAELPQLTFFCGAVNRRAVEDIVEEFQRREGVEVNTKYQGCGILTSNMKLIKSKDSATGFPDIYMACDVYYLENVKEWFQEAVNVSDAEIVIAVPKGSEKVTKLSDLLKPGVRVSVGEPDQCTIGALTRRLLRNEGIYEKLKEKQQTPGELVIEKSSSSHLVPDVITPHIDASVAYITDVLANRDKVDIVRIDSPNNKAIQPLSISRSSPFKHLARRLLKKIAESPEAFEKAGFHYRLGEEEDRSAAASKEGP